MFCFQRCLSRFKKHHSLNELVETIISCQVTLLKLKGILKIINTSKFCHQRHSIPFEGQQVTFRWTKLWVWENSNRLGVTD